MSEKHLTYEQAAEFLGINKSTLYALVSQRRIPHIRISGRLVRFAEAELRAWLRSKAVDVRTIEGSHDA